MKDLPIILEAIPDTRGMCEICMESLRKRVYAATTGTGQQAIVLAVSSALAGVDVEFAAELFEVAKADMVAALMEVQ